VAANIQSDTKVSQIQTLLGQRGSNARFGNLVLIPINQSLLYVRPFFVEAESTQIPELREVVVWYQGRVAIESTLHDALVDIFGNAPATQEEAGGAPNPTVPGQGASPTSPTSPQTNQSVGALLAQASTAFDDAQKALQAGDLATYQKRINDARALVQQAQRASGGGSGSAGGAGGAGTTTTTAGPTTSTTAGA
jgi:uncharacterized membrane protein (UPF0182 family)